MGMAPPSACRLTAADSLLSACPIFYVKWQREFFSGLAWWAWQGWAWQGWAWPALEQNKIKKTLIHSTKSWYQMQGRRNMMCIFIGIAIVRSWSTLKAKCQFHCGSQGIKEDTRCTMLRFHKISAFPYFPAAGNALARVQRVHEPADLWDITFCTRWFEAFSTMCTRWFWGQELSFIEQTAPADPNS